LANSGDDATYIEDHVDEVDSLQPKYIYIAYGVNDMGREVGYWDGQDGYGSVVEEQIDKLLAVDPEANIIVNSIIQCTPEALEYAPRWANVDTYNQELQEMCERRGWVYVDNSTICDYGNADIYQADGVHFYSKFYYTWAQNMITQTFFA
jgi:lysophospholipase L1-like esterase